VLPARSMIHYHSDPNFTKMVQTLYPKPLCPPDVFCNRVEDLNRIKLQPCRYNDSRTTDHLLPRFTIRRFKKHQVTILIMYRLFLNIPILVETTRKQSTSNESNKYRKEFRSKVNVCSLHQW